MKIGFIGQGFIGKNYADDFENRGYEVVRYALGSEYEANKGLIKECDIVFIAVPTPSTPEGFDYSIVENVVSLVGEGKTVVIKSTLVPGSTQKIQENNPDKIVLFSPEFLCEVTADKDAANPMFNIVGTDLSSEEYVDAAKRVHEVLPKCEHNFTVDIRSAELFKYVHNIHGFMRVIFSNLFADISQVVEADWSQIKPIMDIDPMMSPYYNEPIHKSGRGAGGNCFVKDMAAFRGMYETLLTDDSKGIEVLRAMESKNLELLKTTDKSQDIVKGVYGTAE
jgi:UDPglucose 6-dehydrogenase